MSPVIVDLPYIGEGWCAVWRKGWFEISFIGYVPGDYINARIETLKKLPAVTVRDDGRRVLNHFFQKIIEYTFSKEFFYVTAPMPQDIWNSCYLRKEISNDPIRDEVACIYEVNLVFAGDLKCFLQQPRDV